jgi:hypothetical protein
MRGAPTAAAAAEAEAEREGGNWNRYGLASGDKWMDRILRRPPSRWLASTPDAKYSILIKSVVGRIRFAGAGEGEVARQMKRGFDEYRQDLGDST